MSRTPQEIADDLIGCSGGSRPSIEAEIEELSLQDTQEFDMIAFLCEECGWWCSTDDLRNLDGHERCNECNPENEDSDDD